MKPRLGFLGAGWIGRNRLEAIAASGLAVIAAVADADPELARSAAAAAPGAAPARDLDDLLGLGLDAVVIATPSALHADQAIRALRSGAAVFCQKPLGRNAAETRAVVEAARDADRLLGVDLSYRHVTGMRRIRERVRLGAIGKVFAADLVFHNAYGPDKPWYYDLNLSGGGCVIDLGIHLVDLALWTLCFPEVTQVTGRLYSGGLPLENGHRASAVEDYATARIDLASGVALNLACSWKISAGRDCAIEAVFHGTGGGLALRNLNGSFYDLAAEQYQGTRSEVLDPLDNTWGGRAALAWTEALVRDRHFDPELLHAIKVAEVLDAIYDR